MLETIKVAPLGIVYSQNGTQLTVRHELDMNIVLTPVDILGTLEEARHIVLENRERLVQLLEDADNSVVLLNVLLCLSHRYLCIEASEEKENG